MPDSMIQVLLVERHPIVREGLKTVLQSHVDLSISGEVDTAQNVTVEHLDASDVAIIGTNVSCSTGIHMVELLEADTSTLIFSACPEEVYAPRLLRVGADGYVPQTADGGAIVEAVRTVARGQTYVSSDLAQVIADKWRGGSERDLDCLSNREFQVIRLVAAGKSIESIAERLCVSEATVSTYKRRIRNKLGIGNDVEMAWYAWSRDLVEHPE